MSISITGLGIGLPRKIVTNEELAKLVDTSDKWIRTRTGIETRHVCDKETLLDLAFAAAKQALQQSKTASDELDLIICATLRGDFVTPSLACTLQNELKAKCPAFDINAACSGFNYALATANGFIKAMNYKKVLIVCAEKMSSLIDWTQRETCVLFGDGAAACIIEPGDSLKYINLTAVGDNKILNMKVGGGNNPFGENEKPAFLYMNGQEVYKFASNAALAEIEKGLSALSITAEKPDYFILHQANMRIIESVSHLLKVPMEKFPANIQKYGNISSGSVLLLLYELMQDKKIKKGDLLFLVSFGAGLTSSGSVITWQL